MEGIGRGRWLMVVGTAVFLSVVLGLRGWALGDATAAPTGMVMVPAGSFQMGDAFGEGMPDEVPVHTVYVSSFYIDATEVTKALWDEVAAWARAHSYDVKPSDGLAQGPDHPVYLVSWYAAVKWANARSEREGLTPCYYTDETRRTVYRTGKVDLSNACVDWNATGYRLPTEAEWERAARGGCEGHRFPWCHVDTIDHSRANYYSTLSQWYDKNLAAGYHPKCRTQNPAYTSPVGTFGPNAFGIYDMAGNVWEWCWDWYSGDYYATLSFWVNPHGPPEGAARVVRGGSWLNDASTCRVAARGYSWASGARPCRIWDRPGSYPASVSVNCNPYVGLRLVRRLVVEMDSPD